MSSPLASSTSPGPGAHRVWGRSAPHCPHPGGLKARPGSWGLRDGWPVTRDPDRVQASVCSLTVFTARAALGHGAQASESQPTARLVTPLPREAEPGPQTRQARVGHCDRETFLLGSSARSEPRPVPCCAPSLVFTSLSTGAVFFSIFLTLDSGAGPSPSFPGTVLGRLWPWSPWGEVDAFLVAAQPVRLVPSLRQQDPLLDTARGRGRDLLRTGSAGRPGWRAWGGR